MLQPPFEPAPPSMMPAAADRHHGLLGWSGQQLRTALPPAAASNYQPGVEGRRTLHGLAVNPGGRVKSQWEATPGGEMPDERRLPKRLDPRFAALVAKSSAKRAQPPAGEQQRHQAPRLRGSGSTGRMSVPHGSLASQLAPQVPMQPRRMRASTSLPAIPAKPPSSDPAAASLAANEAGGGAAGSASTPIGGAPSVAMQLVAEARRASCTASDATDAQRGAGGRRGSKDLPMEASKRGQLAKRRGSRDELGALGDLGRGGAALLACAPLGGGLKALAAAKGGGEGGGKGSLLARFKQAANPLVKASRQMSMASSMLNTLGERVRERRAAYVDILGKPPAERTAEDLGFLMDWAKQIRFKDEEVQKMVNRELLCKVMKLQRCEVDDIIIGQGEEGDAFYVVFSGVATVYVTYETEEAQNKKKGKGGAKPGPAAGGFGNPNEGQEVKELPEGAFDENGRYQICKDEEMRRRVRHYRRHERGEPVHTPRGEGEEGEEEDELSDGERFSDSFTKLKAAEAPPAPLEVEVPPAEEGVEEGHKTSRVFAYREYECFGDLALLFNAPRSASVVAEEETIVVRVDREDYDDVVKATQLEAVRQRARFLSTLPVFSGYHLQHLVNVASFLKRELHSPGEMILPENHSNDDIFIVESGDVEVQRRVTRGMPPRRMLTLGQGSFIGALDMPQSTLRTLVPSLVSSKHAAATLLRLSRREFEYRAGRATTQRMAAAEVSAWLQRLSAPGPLRALFAAPSPGTASAGSLSVGSLSASSSPAGQRRSRVASPAGGGGAAWPTDGSSDLEGLFLPPAGGARAFHSASSQSSSAARRSRASSSATPEMLAEITAWLMGEKSRLKGEGRGVKRSVAGTSSPSPSPLSASPARMRGQMAASRFQTVKTPPASPTKHSFAHPPRAEGNASPGRPRGVTIASID